MKKRFAYLRTWLKDFRGIALHELKQIFTDSGVLLIFFVAGLGYPLLYNFIYSNGILEEMPLAVVDKAACPESRRFAREMDATREARVAYKCMNMDEAQRLMQEGKVRGIVCFPSDFGQKIAQQETATLSLYCNMSSFFYYKNAFIAANQVMLHEIGEIQLERYTAAGMSLSQAEQVVQPMPYEENNPYNPAFAYNIFLMSAVLLVIIQQTLFYGMSLLTGTMRERNRSFASLPDRLSGHGVGRVVFGRGAAYGLVYLLVGLYIATVVPGLFGIPQRGQFVHVALLLAFFVADCVFFSMTWSTLITRRESVFVLFLFMSFLCLFLTGTSWPNSAIPKFWRAFAALFPTTYGCRAFLNVSTAGAGLASARTEFVAMTLQTAAYAALSFVAVYAENWVLKHRDRLKQARRELDAKVGIDREKDLRIIAGPAERE